MKKIKKKAVRTSIPVFMSIALAFFVLFMLFLVFQSIKSSLFFNKKERINIIVYGQDPVMYSIDLNDNIHYTLRLYPDMEVQVPGGYGEYRIGALGKLASLWKKPDIFRKTFTANTSTFIHYYFYSPNSKVYYGTDENTNIRFPRISEFMRMKSNAQFLDKIYLAYLFSKENQKQIKELRSLTAEYFAKEYQGYFYHRIYRSEKKNVGIEYYRDFKTAESLGRILEGSGIRVSDYKTDTALQKKCFIIEETGEFSQTARDLGSFFNCGLKKGDTDVYDIIFALGPLEKEWEVD